LKTKLLPLTAILAVSIYLVFTLAAVLSYPHPYSPLTNWLSDFGNPTRNPSGAVYYNTGGILASAVLVLFFAGMYTLKTADKKAQVFLALSQITGIVFAFCFFMSAMVPLGVNDSLHSVFSMMLFVFLGFFEIFSASAIRRKPFNAKPLFFFGIFAAMINFVWRQLQLHELVRWRMDNDSSFHRVHHNICFKSECSIEKYLKKPYSIQN
jgi:hypothetical membrane protein